jgi:hypothetical protein
MAVEVEGKPVVAWPSSFVPEGAIVPGTVGFRPMVWNGRTT